MNKALVPNKEVYSFLRHSMEKSKAQDNALEVVINRMEEIESNVIGVRDEVLVLKNEVKGDLDDMRNRITIDYECQKTLQSIVKRKSNAIAVDHYEDYEKFGAEIRELSGYATRILWGIFKKRYFLTRYTSLRQVDYEKGKDFLKDINLGSDFINNYKQWKYQRAKKREREAKAWTTYRITLKKKSYYSS